MTIEEKIENMRSKAAVYANEAVGLEFRVRLDKRTVQSGKIAQCWVSWVGVRGQAITAMWKVVLERNGVRTEPIQVSMLPRP